MTNGTSPKVLEKLDPLPTQLYLTLPAPDEASYKKTCNPLGNYWKEINESLDVMKGLDCRKVIRLTLVRGLNFTNPEDYGKLVLKAMPDYLEPKSYMHVGYSIYRLGTESMPIFSEIRSFAEKLSKETGYGIYDESEPSRVVLMCRDEKAFANRMIKIQVSSGEKK